MNTKQIIDICKGTTWRLDLYGSIRNRERLDLYGSIRNRGLMCPITFACFEKNGKYFKLEEWAKAAEYLELPEEQAMDLISAADNDLFLRDIKIRELRDELRDALLIKGVA